MTTKLSTERIADLYSWATAWRSTDPDGGTDLSGLRASNRAEFDMWLAEHDRDLKLTAAEDLVYVRRIEAERDEAIAQRDASRQVNAEFLAAAHTAALAAQNTVYRDKPMNEGVGE